MGLASFNHSAQYTILPLDSVYSTQIVLIQIAVFPFKMQSDVKRTGRTLIGHVKSMSTNHVFSASPLTQRPGTQRSSFTATRTMSFLNLLSKHATVRAHLTVPLPVSLISLMRHISFFLFVMKSLHFLTNFISCTKFFSIFIRWGLQHHWRGLVSARPVSLLLVGSHKYARRW